MIRLIPLGFVSLVAFGEGPHYLTSIQFFLQEPSPSLNSRAQRVVLDRFSTVLPSIPQLREKHFDVQSNGHHLTLTLLSREDAHHPLEAAVMEAVRDLQGQVRARGISRFYRAASAPIADLEMDVNPDRTRVTFVRADSVPLIEFLKELRSKLAKFSYLVSEACSEVRINWAFGEPAQSSVGGEKRDQEGKTVEQMLTDLKTVGLRWERTQQGHYVFNGCVIPEPLLEAELPERLPIHWPPLAQVPYRSRVLFSGWD